MCSACITISPAGVEQRRRGVAALLDVRGVRRADQHGAHLLAGGAQRAGERPAARSGRSCSPRLAVGPRSSEHACRSASTSPLQPGGTSSVASGSAHSAGPATARAAARLAAQTLGEPTGCRREHDLAPRSAHRCGRAPRPRGGSSGAAPQTETRIVDELDLGAAVAVAVARARARARRPRAALGAEAGAGAPSAARELLVDGQLEGLPAVAQLVAQRARAGACAERAPRALASSASRSRRRRSAAERVAAAASRVRAASRRGAAAARPSAREHAGGARAEHARDAERARERSRVQRARRRRTPAARSRADRCRARR